MAGTTSGMVETGMVERTAVARDSLEWLINRDKEREAESLQLRTENQELKAEVADLKKTMKLLEPFIEIAKDPPKNLMVSISDEAVVQQLLGWGIKYYGDALGNPDHSKDDATRKQARRNIANFVTACCKFGLQRRDDVHRQFLTHT